MHRSIRSKVPAQGLPQAADFAVDEDVGNDYGNKAEWVLAIAASKAIVLLRVGFVPEVL
jgi:hypothetical protein